MSHAAPLTIPHRDQVGQSTTVAHATECCTTGLTDGEEQDFGCEPDGCEADAASPELPRLPEPATCSHRPTQPRTSACLASPRP